jgi:hypothetical protein
MNSYRHPSKTSEIVFCHAYMNHTSCADGHGFDPEKVNLPLSVLEVGPSSLGKYAGRGVFTKDDIPWLSYVGLEELIHIVHIGARSFELITKMDKQHASLFSRSKEEEEPEGWWAHALEMYTHGYGSSSSHRVSFLFCSCLSEPLSRLKRFSFWFMTRSGAC